MITKINKINNYGIFRDFLWDSNLSSFKKVNLFYGLNGSGKSTLSTIFYAICKKELRQFNGYFKIEDEQLGCIESTAIDSIHKNIYVFNSQFIEDNIGEYSNLKGIVYISEQNKEAKEALDSLKKEREKVKTEYNAFQIKYDSAEKALDSAYISVAKAIKNEFQFIGGAGAKFSNYNKTSFKNALEKYQDYLNADISLPNILDQIEEEKSFIKDEIKDKLDLPHYNFDANVVKNLLLKTKDLLSETPKKCFKDNIADDIFTWLEEGYRLHATNNICHYCGGVITPDRKAYLDNLFNDEMTKLQIDLKELKVSWEGLLIPEINTIESNLYTSKQALFAEYLNKYQLLRNKVNNFIKSLVEKLDAKIANPFASISISETFDTIFSDVTEVIDGLTSIIAENNNMTDSFERKQKDAVNKIEKLLVYKAYVEFKIYDLTTAFKKSAKQLKDKEVIILTIQKQIETRENELIDVIKASLNFNKILSQFLGRDELFLQYDEQSKGYRIKRKNTNNNAKCLSEGEKTAIAFIYFLTKVCENGNNISDSTIVFDDPISSFDSNHLFNAFSFIETYFAGCEQLFILTHNFNFFKLLRRKYCKNAEMYLIQNDYLKDSKPSVRYAKIAPLPKSLKQASSEYCYLFEKMYKFYNEPRMSAMIEYNDYMQMSNICRKVLESFASFKIPNITDLSQKIKGLYKCNRPTDYKLTDSENMDSETIYRFVNAFSHDCLFEDIGGADIVFGELYTVVGKILNLIKQADKDHFNAQLKSIS